MLSLWKVWRFGRKPFCLRTTAWRLWKTSEQTGGTIGWAPIGSRLHQPVLKYRRGQRPVFEKGVYSVSLHRPKLPLRDSHIIILFHKRGCIHDLTLNELKDHVLRLTKRLNAIIDAIKSSQTKQANTHEPSR